MICLQRVFALAILFSAVIFSSCRKVKGEGPVRTETRTANNFSGIDMRIAGNLYFREDNNYRLEISAQQNILDVIDTYVSNGTLVIKEKSGVIIKNREDITVNVYAPAVSGLKLSGSGNINADRIKGSGASIEISGSGDIDVNDLAVSHLDAKVSGSGNMRVLNGTLTSETLKITGSGDIDLLKVAAKSANTSTTGSGTMRVNVTENLNVTISGSGSVFYVGTPKISSHVSGSGRVVPW